MKWKSQHRTQLYKSMWGSSLSSLAQTLLSCLEQKLQVDKSRQKSLVLPVNLHDKLRLPAPGTAPYLRSHS